MAAAPVISRPELTMPEAEAAALRAAYAGASAILEYGSGGSTAMAGEMTGKRIVSVESDRAWVEMMEGWFAANPPASPVKMIHADVGPTKDWGHPVDDRAWRRFPGYPLDVWESGAAGAPDVVLVDGRFRVGCALATAFHTTRPVMLYFDDYAPRKQYHVVEEVLGPPERIGRMARFQVKPTPLPVARLTWVMRMMTRP